MQNNRRPFDSYTVPVTTADPGPDGRVGSADDPGSAITYDEYPVTLAGAAFQQPTLINDSRSDQRYTTIEFAVSRRLVKRWQLMGSYSATKLAIPYVQNTSGVSDFASPGLAVFLATYDPNADTR